MNLSEHETEKNTEFANENGNADHTNKQNSSYELIERTEIPTTPFTVATIEDGRSRIMWGNWMLSDWMTKEDAISEAPVVTWDRMLEVFNIVMTEYDKKINAKSLLNDN